MTVSLLDCAKYQVDETQSTRLRYRSQTKNKGKTSSEVEPDTKPLQIQTFIDIQAFLLSEDELEKENDEEEVLAAGDDMDEDPQDDAEASIEEYYEENIAHRDQTDQLVAASMSSLDKSSSSISDLYKGLNVITELLKHINNVDTLEIKSMMAEIYQAFKGQPSSTPSGSVTLTLALTHTLTYVEGENATNTATEEPLSHTEGDTGDTIIAIPISSIHPTKSDEDPSKILVTASTIIRPDPDKLVRVEFMINRKIVYLAEQEIQEYWDKEEKMKKAAEEAKLLAMYRPEVIKVVHEEAKKLRIDPKDVISTKAGETFKKAQDAEHEVLKREHSKKVKQLTKLNRSRVEEYMWTMTNRIKPEPITDVRIHPITKPIVASVFRNNDKRNFDFHQPFKFSDFGISELDELGPIIQKKKNSVVKDLMTSLSKRYERLKKIPEEHGIQSDLPALVPEQASS
ncbi:hypothetical protein Tco_0820496 [Tanacetum coccineum]|uniref:Uncharacterized protein n=1 Tax=Tanacetum coccineum TaxID=301880 RepID=A0ABQ5AC70_9ASTR